MGRSNSVRERAIFLIFVDEEVATRVEIAGKTKIEKIETRPEKPPRIHITNKKTFKPFINTWIMQLRLHSTRIVKDAIPGAWARPECAEVTANGHEMK